MTFTYRAYTRQEVCIKWTIHSTCLQRSYSLVADLRNTTTVKLYYRERNAIIHIHTRYYKNAKENLKMKPSNWKGPKRTKEGLQENLSHESCPKDKLEGWGKVAGWMKRWEEIPISSLYLYCLGNSVSVWREYSVGVRIWTKVCEY